jgi:hypothetical protein
MVAAKKQMFTTNDDISGRKIQVHQGSGAVDGVTETGEPPEELRMRIITAGDFVHLGTVVNLRH